MNKLLNGTFALSLIVLASISAYGDPGDTLYIVDTSGRIGAVNLATDTVSVIGKTGESLTDIAFTSNGDLYGTTDTALYSINTSTAASSLIASYGALGGGLMDGLVGDGSELLASSYASTNLYAIDLSPEGITTLTGSTKGDSAGDLAFGPNGELYETLNTGYISKITLSGSTITSSIVGNTGHYTVYGLATADTGVTYAVSGTEIFVVDLNNASLTPFFNYAGHGLGAVSGAAIIPVAVPEPANLLLLAMGLLLLVLFRGQIPAIKRQPLRA